VPAHSGLQNPSGPASGENTYLLTPYRIKPIIFSPARESSTRPGTKPVDFQGPGTGTGHILTDLETIDAGRKIINRT